MSEISTVKFGACFPTNLLYKGDLISIAGKPLSNSDSLINSPNSILQIVTPFLI